MFLLAGSNQGPIVFRSIFEKEPSSQELQGHVHSLIPSNPQTTNHKSFRLLSKQMDEQAKHKLIFQWRSPNNPASQSLVVSTAIMLNIPLFLRKTGPRLLPPSSRYDVIDIHNDYFVFKEIFQTRNRQCIYNTMAVLMSLLTTVWRYCQECKSGVE